MSILAEITQVSSDFLAQSKETFFTWENVASFTAMSVIAAGLWGTIKSDNSVFKTFIVWFTVLLFMIAYIWLGSDWNNWNWQSFGQEVLVAIINALYVTFVAAGLIGDQIIRFVKK